MQQTYWFISLSTHIHLSLHFKCYCLSSGAVPLSYELIQQSPNWYLRIQSCPIHPIFSLYYHTSNRYKKNVSLISLLYLKPFNGSSLFVQIQSPEHCKLHDLALSLILHKTNYSFLSSYVMLFGLSTWNALPYFTLVISLLYHSLNCTHLLFGYTVISSIRMKAPGEQRPFFIYFWIPKK